jgi:hypothetical protein
MNLNEMDKKVLSLIEELNPNSEHLTDDPDIQAKKRYVTNQVMFELARIKKIPKYFETEVKKGDLVSFANFAKECGYEIYQVSRVSGVNHSVKANGTVYKAMEDGTMEVDCFIYPERITDKTKGNYEFELSDDVLEVMPYGIAADLLKSDVSAEYGNIYATRYESMKQLLDPRYQIANITFKGGAEI